MLRTVSAIAERIMNWAPTGLSLFLTCGALLSAEPANTNANTKTRAVLNYFHSLTNRTDKRILSGQFAAFGKGASLKLMNEVHDRTGQWPGVMGADYADFGSGGLTFKSPNQASIDYSRQGGFVTSSAHLYNPANAKGG